MSNLVITPDDVLPSSYASRGYPIVYGADIVQGMPIYKNLNDNGNAWPAQATSAAAANAIGIATVGGGRGQTGYYLITDPNLALGLTLAQGAIFCVSATQAGAICPYGDLDQGDYVTILGASNLSSNLNFAIIAGSIGQGGTMTSYVRTTTLSNGIDSGTVDYSALGLSAPPSVLGVIGVNKYNGGGADENIYGDFILGSPAPTATGASFELNAPTDNANRELVYILIP